MMSRHHLVLAIGLVLAGTIASADTPTERADAMFKRGKELMAGKRFAEACTAFDRSYQIEAAVTTLLNRADCREKNDQLATAWKLFVEAENQTHAATDEAGKQMNATAIARSEKLHAHMSWLAIVVAGTRSELTVTIDGVPVDVERLDKPMPIDGGTHAIAVRASGYREWSKTIKIRPAGDTQTVPIPALEPEASPTISDDATPVAGTTDETRHASLGPTLIAAGAAVVIGAVGFGLWRSGASLYDQAKAEPDDARQEELWQSANTRRYLAEGFAITAVGCAAIAGVLYVRHARGGEDRKMSFAPAASSTSIGVVFGRAW